MNRAESSISSEDVARHYDDLDAIYPAIWGDHMHHGLWPSPQSRINLNEARRALVNLVIEKADLPHGERRVLDVGCGYGAAARAFAKRPDVEVIGLTISPSQQRHAQSHGASTSSKNVSFIVEDWLQNQQPSGHYDLVIAIESTEHMADKVYAFREMSRVLKPGGKLVLCAWLSGDHVTPWQRRHLVDPAWAQSRIPAMGTKQEYDLWIEQAGFVIQDATDLSDRVRRTWPASFGHFFTTVRKKPELWWRLLDLRRGFWRFGVTMLRIWLAYRIGAMRYVLFVSTRPESP